ncbi:MAG TPA: helix-turn-helix domain-containing protein [Acidimicrobiia bacterium]|nr:helix-turn-helix domain-containing protein [Acidimicrobiia bacterium]
MTTQLAEAQRPPQQDRSQRKLARLLASGRELFAERGFAATRVQDIAAGAGCSVGVFYQRFADKDACFAAVAQQFLDEVERAATAINERAGALDARELLREHVEHGVALFRGHRGLLRAFLRYEATNPGFDVPLARLLDRLTTDLVDALRATGARIAHPDPDAAVALGAQVVRGALVHEAFQDAGALPLDDEHLVDELTDLFASYLRIS